MRPGTLALLVLLLAGCGAGTGHVADDPGDPPSGTAPPAEVPSAPGDVSTRGVVTVLDDGSGAQLCLGAVAESWPPQCGGPPLRNWDWKRERLVLGQPGGGPAFEETSGVRWGRYFLTGRWDGESFTVATSVPEAWYDAPATDPPSPPAGPAPELSDTGLQDIARDLLGRLPGTLSSEVADGRAQVRVVYDDGTLQDWADATYGAGTVVVTSALVDVPDVQAPTTPSARA